jgi:hypothetical protein
MKTKNNTRLDLRKFPKSVRQAINEKKNEINNHFYDELRSLLNRSVITKEDFIGLFKKHLTNVFLEGAIDIDNISFKTNNTPDLRSLPKAVRDILRSFEKEEEQKKADYITKALSDVPSLSIGLLNDILEMSKENSFQKKWIAAPRKELVSI